MHGGRGTLFERGQAVLDAMAAGTLTPDTAATIMQAVAAQAKAVEVAELEKRVAALEATSANAAMSAP